MATQRVKVYRLNSDGLWDDKGTGHVSVEFLEQSQSAGLVVISEDETHRTLLIHRISSDEIYLRQGDDTIITWSDPDLGTDIALSFEESAGCTFIWEQIQQIESDSSPTHRPGLPNGRTGGPEPTENGVRPSRVVVDEFEAATAFDGRVSEGAGSGPVTLPAPDLKHLAETAKVLSEVSLFQRDAVAAQAARGPYIRRVLNMFRAAEDLEDGDSLRRLHAVVRGLILLNDASVLEALFCEENVFDAVGALEYDPDLPEQQKHREFLRDKVVFKEVIAISDAALRAKIHETYRLAYVKDVILPRVLDDATFATLSSLILFNNVEVLLALQSDAHFLPELFRRLKEPGGFEARRDQLGLLQDLCGLAKQLQPGQRNVLYGKLVGLGAFQVVTAVLRAGPDELRLVVLDTLSTIVQHNPGLLHTFIMGQPEQELLALLVGPLLAGSEQGLQEAALDVLSALLNPNTLAQKEACKEVLDVFYDKYMAQVVAVLVSASGPSGADSAGASPGAGPGAGARAAPVSASVLGSIVELLCFCVVHHGYQIKYYVLRNNVVEKVLGLLQRREQWLAVAAVRFLRTCVGTKDVFYNRYLERGNLFEPVLKKFLANGRRNNLLSSTVLELVDFIRRSNLKELVRHLVEAFWDQLRSVDFIDTFQALKLRHDQNQESGEEVGPPGDTAVGPAPGPDAARRRRDERSLDKDEEDYFREDDEPASPSGGASPSSPGPLPLPLPEGGLPLPGRARKSLSPPPLANPLVDYDDDEEGENTSSTGVLAELERRDPISNGQKRQKRKLSLVDTPVKKPPWPP